MPTVTALRDRPDREACVHVLGGGEAGARAVADLRRAGYSVSLGVVPEGDTAAETARGLGCVAVTAPPFEVLDADAVATVTDLLDRADACLDTGGPGSGPTRERVDVPAGTVGLGDGADAATALLEEGPTPTDGGPKRGV
jgi:iron complex transport system ATP-binding protein